jgi:hypothetical protein
MIRNAARRLGDTLETSQGCIEYQDPDTGEFIQDPNTLCQDPGESGALQQFAGDTQSAADLAALNAPALLTSSSATQPLNIALPAAAAQPASSGVGIGPIPLNLNLPELPSWIWWAAGGIVALLLLEGSNRR